MKNQWKSRFNSNPPKSPATMKMILDWYEVGELERERMNVVIGKLEELVDLSGNDQLSKNIGNKLTKGTTLIKVWRGRKYEVLVVSEGYLYEGESYKSLTSLAKKITGRHQSGNVFFGLDKNKTKELKDE